MIPFARSTVIEDGPPRFDRGFVLSDHADWPGLLAAIAATEAETVWLTHGVYRGRGPMAPRARPRLPSRWRPVTRGNATTASAAGGTGPALSSVLPTQDRPRLRLRTCRRRPVRPGRRCHRRSRGRRSRAPTSWTPRRRRWTIAAAAIDVVPVLVGVEENAFRRWRQAPPTFVTLISTSPLTAHCRYSPPENEATVSVLSTAARGHVDDLHLLGPTRLVPVDGVEGQVVHLAVGQAHVDREAARASQ